MDNSLVRVLVVEDFEPWRRFIHAELDKRADLTIVCEATDGLEAVQKAGELQPDLILLDVGLPTLNGIEVARRIREQNSKSKILFVSENRSSDVAEEALRAGGGGYVVKSDVASDLLLAVDAVLSDRQFISASLANHFVMATTLTSTLTTQLTTIILIALGIY